MATPRRPGNMSIGVSSVRLSQSAGVGVGMLRGAGGFPYLKIKKGVLVYWLVVLLLSWFLGSWFLGVKDSWFLGFLYLFVSWLQRF